MKNISKGLKIMQGIWVIGFLLLCYIGFFATSPKALAQSFTFSTIDIPGASNGTTAQGINDNGEIVGQYSPSCCPSHGFLLPNGVSSLPNYTQIDDPNANSTDGTHVFGINKNGDVVGQYRDTGGAYHGYLLSGGNFSMIDISGASHTEATGINDKGHIVGWFVDTLGVYHGFFLPNGISSLPTPTQIDDPNAGSGQPPFGGTYAYGINNKDEIVGFYWDSSGVGRGFMHSGNDFTTNFTTINEPNACTAYGTRVNGINDNEQIVGFFYDVSCNGLVHGFMHSGTDFTTNFTTIDIQGAADTFALGINNTGELVGGFSSNAPGHGFLASFYVATVQQPINSDGTSVFNAKRGVVPVQFTLTLGGASTCDLPPATISVTRTSGGTIGPVDENSYIMAADSGSNFRISGCQYIYNLLTSSLGTGTYLVQINISGFIVGSATFGLE